MRSLIYPLFLLVLAGPAFAQDRANAIIHGRDNAFRSVAVTPNDSTPVDSSPTSAIYVGAAAACNLAVLLNGDTSTVTFAAVQPGEILPIQVVLVKTASTCTNIVALFDR